MNGFVAGESVGDSRDNEAMFERYSARARSVIFLALGCARMRGAAYIAPEFFPDDVEEKVAESVGGPAQGRRGGEGRHARFALLKQALASAATIAQERDSRTIEALHLLAARQSGRNGEAPGYLATGFEAVPRGEKGVKKSHPAKKVPFDLAGGGYPLTTSCEIPAT